MSMKINGSYMQYTYLPYSIMPKTVMLLILLAEIKVAMTKVYGRCELVNELATKYEIPDITIPKVVYIAQKESSFRTHIINWATLDYGLLQINKMWFRPCGVSFRNLTDDDITDDLICAKMIYDIHSEFSKSGFNAWAVYSNYTDEKGRKLLEGC